MRRLGDTGREKLGIDCGLGVDFYVGGDIYPSNWYGRVGGDSVRCVARSAASSVAGL